MQLAMGETSVLATPKRYSQETAVEGDVKVNYDQNSVKPGPCLTPIGYSLYSRMLFPGVGYFILIAYADYI